MKAIIKHPKYSGIYFDNEYYKTNSEIDVPLLKALKISLTDHIEFEKPELEYNPEFWKNRDFVLWGNADNSSGFGTCTRNIAYYMDKIGYHPHWIGNGMKVAELNSFIKEVDNRMPAIYHEQPKHEWFDSVFYKKIAIVPFETTQIPKSWVSRINYMDSLFTLSDQNIQMMKDSGVRVPIEKIIWGVESEKFPVVERNNEFFTFGQAGFLTMRKGTDILIQAFKLAFPKKKDVRLIIKTSNSIFPFNTKEDPDFHNGRIELIMETNNDQGEMARDVYNRIDCGVFPWLGEGFSLVPFEFMSTGIPVIVTDWGGISEYITDDLGWKIEHTMISAENFSKLVYKEPCGDWANPNLDDLVDKMRYAYLHQDEVRKKGRKSAQFIRDNFTWETAMNILADKLNKYF